MMSRAMALDFALLLPMIAHVALAAFLYVWLTVARAPAIWGIGRRADGGNPWAKIEPRIGANLSNQFEWPLFFHIACVLLMLIGTSTTAVVLAWVFVGGRGCTAASRCSRRTSACAARCSP
jgi:hypothetical protein